MEEPLRLMVLRGLPASGKSTFARGLEASDPSRWVRVNKDDIRARLLSTGWTKEKERTVVIPERDRLITQALVSGKNVVVDDTNFEAKHMKRFHELAGLFSAVIEVRDFEIDVEEAIRRDAGRARPVGEAVIRDMAARHLGYAREARKYVPPQGAPGVVICDLDGTVALFCHRQGCGCDLHHRSPYNAATADRDTPNQPVVELVRTLLGTGTKVVFLSGREDLYREQTEAFLRKHVVGERPELTLLMRKAGDFRKDSVIKAEIFDAEIRDRYRVQFVLDDRDQVVRMWRSLGLVCLQVAEGNF